MVIIKSDEEIAIMRKCGRILASILERLRLQVRPGMKTTELDTIMAEESKKRGVTPSFKNYRGFPANLCVSVNDEIVYGIPGQRILEEGDVVSVDVGARLSGFHTDAAVTIGVGGISKEAEGLIMVTEGSLKSGITQALSGAWLADIS